MAEPYHSRVYTDRPAYADFDAPNKFQAIESIIGRRLIEHPNAVCSYSGGADKATKEEWLEMIQGGLIAAKCGNALFL